MTPLTFTTGSAVVGIESESLRFRRSVLAAAGTPPVLGGPAAPDVVVAQAAREQAGGPGVPIARGATRANDGSVMFASAGGSGFRQRWHLHEGTLRVESQWDPSAKESAAARALPARFRALRGQVLLHHPVLWWASLQGLAPLHVSVVEVAGTVVALAGPGGVGKTSLVARELARSAQVTCDNLAVSDGVVAYGLREPLRLPADTAPGGASGPRAAHGRREAHGTMTVPALRPDAVVVVRRDGTAPGLRAVSGDVAHRALVAGTMAAGELMRFWSTAAVLALATGRGPVTPPVDDCARRLVDRLPAYELQLGPTPGGSLRELLSSLVGSPAEVSG
ncbi:MAG TPA: hypothetical protein VGK78_18915 [Nocardioides sp.]|uniref:hypothetical protein n=1 Tax=Nocardioides sp. TaxID=35761 RepID=UPI002F415664